MILVTAQTARGIGLPDGAWRWLEPGERIQRGDWTDLGSGVVWHEVEPHEEGYEIMPDEIFDAVRRTEAPR